jgi:hypothetical protein
MRVIFPSENGGKNYSKLGVLAQTAATCAFNVQTRKTILRLLLGKRKKTKYFFLENFERK